MTHRAPPQHLKSSSRWCWRAWLLPATALLLGAAACTPTVADTVDLGDNFDSPEIAIDEDFYFCEIQPNVISKNRCAAGGSGDGDGCHAQKSALRLIVVPSEARCQDGRVIGNPPDEAAVNLERVRASLGPDADASPLYRRPLGLDSHPRVIFDMRSAEAMLLRQWLNGGGT